MPLPPEPLVRARFCQEWLEFVGGSDEPYRSRFRERLDPGMREAIESASRVAWLPAGFHVTLADVLQETFGVTRAHAYYRRAFASSLSGPVLGPLMRSATRVLGLTPATFVRWASHGWEAAFRNSGKLTGEVLGPDRGRLVYQGLPPVFTRSVPWMESAQGSVYGAFDILAVDGIVRQDLSGRDEGEMVIYLEWSKRQ